MSAPTERGRIYGDWICLDWHDGPFSEIALVTFDDGNHLVEIKSQGGWVGEDYRTGWNGEKFYVNHMRFDRETLVAMLDLIDGKPVKDFHDEVTHTEPTMKEKERRPLLAVAEKALDGVEWQLDARNRLDREPLLARGVIEQAKEIERLCAISMAYADELGEVRRALVIAQAATRDAKLLFDLVEPQVGQRVVTVRETAERWHMPHAHDGLVHEITSLLGGHSHLVECGPQQIGVKMLRLAPAGSEVTCPHCRGWRSQMAKMRADSDAYLDNDALRAALREACEIADEALDEWPSRDAAEITAEDKARIAELHKLAGEP